MNESIRTSRRPCVTTSSGSKVLDKTDEPRDRFDWPTRVKYLRLLLWPSHQLVEFPESPSHHSLPWPLSLVLKYMKEGKRWQPSHHDREFWQGGRDTESGWISVRHRLRYTFGRTTSSGSWHLYFCIQGRYLDSDRLVHRSPVYWVDTFVCILQSPSDLGPKVQGSSFEVESIVSGLKEENLSYSTKVR